MKTVFTTLAAVLATLCTVSTALGGNFEPAGDPAPKDASTASVIELPKLYYSPATNGPTAPQITGGTGNSLSVPIGDRLTIIIQYIGSPMPELISITHDGEEIYNNNRGIINKKYTITEKNGKCTLTKEIAREEDAGTYAFRLKNVVGTAMHSVTVTITEPDK